MAMRILGCSARRPSISVQAYASQSLTKPFHCDSIGAFPRLFRSLPLAAAQPLCFVSPSLSFRCVSFALPLSSVGRHAAPCHFGAAHGSAVPFHRLSVHIYAPSPHRAAEPIHCVAAHIFASPFHCLSSLCSSAAHLCRSAPCEAFPSLGCACLPVAWPCHCASKHCASSPCRSVSWHLMASPLPFCTGPSKSFADLIVALPCFSVSFHLHSGRCVSFPKQRRSAQILSYAHLCYSSLGFLCPSIASPNSSAQFLRISWPRAAAHRLFRSIQFISRRLHSSPGHALTLPCALPVPHT